MKKVFTKITGIVMASAMAMSILITGKVDAKAAAALNVNQEYRLNINDDNKYVYTFTTPQDAVTSVEAYVEDSNYGSIYHTNFQLNVDYVKYWGGTTAKGKGKISSGGFVFAPGKTATIEIGNNLKGFKSIVVLKINTIHIDNLEKEYNNTASTATQIKTKKTYTGVVSAPDNDQDWYVFKAPKTGKYRFYVVNLETSGMLNSLHVDGFKSKTKKDKNVSGSLAAGSGWAKTKPIKLKKGKKYYIKLSGSGIFSVGTQIRVKKVK